MKSLEYVCARPFSLIDTGPKHCKQSYKCDTQKSNVVKKKVIIFFNPLTIRNVSI